MPTTFYPGVWVLCLLVLAGCSGNASRDPESFEVNGFVCINTSEKFYTDKDVFPDHCPAHKNPNFIEVVAFVFANGKTVLGLRADSTMHPTTGERSTGVRFPTEEELVNWGATKKSKEEVTLSD